MSLDNAATTRTLFCLAIAIAMLSVAALVPNSAANQTHDQVSRFEQEILPILTVHCLKCHGQVAPQASLDLRTESSVLKGGKNGSVVVKGSALKSYLFQRIIDRSMPPSGEKPLGAAQIETIRNWIDAGAFRERLVATVTVAKAPEIVNDNNAPLFEQEIRPILTAHCIKCHGNETPQAGLDLRTEASILKGSKNGPVVVKGSADKSYLFQRIANHTMPPPGAEEPLSEAQIQTVRKWIDRGTTNQEAVGATTEASEISDKDRQFWAFRKPIRSSVPKVTRGQRVRTPIDTFVLAKLEQKGLTLSPDAPKLTLIRRAYFDLIGLPPSPEEVEAFLADNKSDAYERLIDHLLASPQYGERWGRHWLDAVGYTDTSKIDLELEKIDYNEGIWRYRDYVIRSFNEDKPYGRFITEQLAGDELVDWRAAPKFTPEIIDLLTATGFLRNTQDVTDFDQYGIEERYKVLFMVMDTVSSSLLGLTLNCARCHDHKYDPIPQRDYFSLMSIFMSAYNPDDWLKPKVRYLPDLSKKDQEEIALHNFELDRPAAELNKQLTELRRPYEQSLFESKLSAVPESLRSDVKAALETPADKRNEVEKFLVKKYGEMLKVSPEEVNEALNQNDKARNAKLLWQIATLNGQRRSYGMIQALWDVGEAPKAHVLRRGQVKAPGPEVHPGFLTVLSNAGHANLTRPPDTMGNSSGRRLALARWLTNREHPLTARVMVNRIWHHHFGKGIVATPENFGHSGMPPTHPELLDWLAVDFMENGWKIKRLHKLIMTSSVYRQSSARPPEGQRALAETVDPDNDLLWRMNLRRIEAEVLRDSLLATSGKLDLTMGGPPIAMDSSSDGLLTVSDKGSSQTSQWRRSLYVLARRNYPLTLLSMFDFPIIETTCPRRTNSATVLQSLTLMNSEFIMKQADHFAKRVMEQVSQTDPAQKKIEMAFRFALARKPTPTETEFCEAHIKTQGRVYLDQKSSREDAAYKALTSLCHMLICSNEFLYVD
jgi:mono/diheme cytochrome c family protein